LLIIKSIGTLPEEFGSTAIKISHQHWFFFFFSSRVEPTTNSIVRSKKDVAAYSSECGWNWSAFQMFRSCLIIFVYCLLGLSPCA